MFLNHKSPGLQRILYILIKYNGSSEWYCPSYLLLSNKLPPKQPFYYTSWYWGPGIWEELSWVNLSSMQHWLRSLSDIQWLAGLLWRVQNDLCMSLTLWEDGWRAELKLAQLPEIILYGLSRPKVVRVLMHLTSRSSRAPVENVLWERK